MATAQGSAMDNAAGIFISYRRQEANYLAGWLHDCLTDHFGETRVFLDIDWIRPGVDFMEVIRQGIAGSGVLLVIIGPHWLAAGPDGDGRRRLDDPSDPVRVEIETALRHDLRIIPLLLDDTVMPESGDLPVGVARLADLNALRVRYESFRADVDRLVRILDDELGTAPTSGASAAGATVVSGPRRRTRTTADRAAGWDVRQDDDQRGRLLTRLSRTYREYLNQSVERDSPLGLRPDLVWLANRTVRPHDRILVLPLTDVPQRAAGPSLLQALDEAGGLEGDGLLILGEPGAGKTTLLLELAHHLAERARTDPRHPLPIYLPVSTWAVRRPPLLDWLVDQLADLYQVPPRLARHWTVHGHLLFLLDGLDEIPDRGDRTACIKAINQFNRFGREYRLPMVVASRPTEYDTQPVRLQLEAALGVRPLDPTVVLDRLRRAGPGMRAAVAVLERDPELLELLRSPLLVSMITLAYAGVTEAEIHAGTGPPAERRRQLITDYIDRRFELDRLASRANERRAQAYPPERTRAWLSALAYNLTRHQQTVLLLGRLQPDWLPTRWARWVIIALPGLAFALSVGLYAGVVGGLGLGLNRGLLAGLGAGLGVRLIGQPQSAGGPYWEWARARSGVGMALLIGLISAVSAGLLFGWKEGVSSGLSVALSVVSAAGLRGMDAGLGTGLSIGVAVGLPAGLGVGLLFGLDDGLSVGLDWGLNVGLSDGLTAGVAAGLVGRPQTAERLSWSWTQARSKLRTVLAVGLLFEVVIGLPFLLHGSPTLGLSVGSLGGLGAWLVAGMRSGPIPLYVTPNEGIKRSARNGVIPAVLVGLLIEPVVVLFVAPKTGLVAALAIGLLTGLPVSLAFGLAYGLGAAAQHGALRLLLWRYRAAPLRYVRWLNHAVQLRLLYRGTSGGYVFIHRMIQEHFPEVPQHPPATSSMPGSAMNGHRRATPRRRHTLPPQRG